MQLRYVRKQDACDLLKSAFIEVVGGDYRKNHKDEDWSNYNWTDQIEEHGPHQFIIQAGGQRFLVMVKKPQG